METDLIKNVRRFHALAFAGSELDGTLPPPASEDAIAQAGVDLGFPLPAGLQELYRFCGGGIPLGPGGWFPVGRVAEVTEDLEWNFKEIPGKQRYYGPNPKFVEIDPLNEGPRATSTVYVQTAGGHDDILVEVDRPDGRPGRVWCFNVHFGTNPWDLLASSLEEYWENLVFLAEAGWYEPEDNQGEVTVVNVAGVPSDPQYRDDLVARGLGHLTFYPG